MVDAFFSAGRAGDFDALAAVLPPTSCCVPTTALASQSDPPSCAEPPPSLGARGSGHAWAGNSIPHWSNGGAGVVVTLHGRPFAVVAFSVTDGKIIEIDVIGDPDRVARVAGAVLGQRP